MALWCMVIFIATASSSAFSPSNWNLPKAWAVSLTQREERYFGASMELMTYNRFRWSGTNFNGLLAVSGPNIVFRSFNQTVDDESNAALDIIGQGLKLLDRRYDVRRSWREDGCFDETPISDDVYALWRLRLGGAAQMLLDEVEPGKMDWRLPLMTGTDSTKMNGPNLTMVTTAKFDARARHALALANLYAEWTSPDHCESICTALSNVSGSWAGADDYVKTIQSDDLRTAGCSSVAFVLDETSGSRPASAQVRTCYHRHVAWIIAHNLGLNFRDAIRPAHNYDTRFHLTFTDWRDATSADFEGILSDCTGCGKERESDVCFVTADEEISGLPSSSSSPQSTQKGEWKVEASSTFIPTPVSISLVVVVRFVFNQAIAV